MTKKKNKKIFDIKEVNFNPTLKFDKLAEPKQMYILDWYESIFMKGIYFDPKRDAKERWELEEILSLWESCVGNMNSATIIVTLEKKNMF